MPNRPVIDIAVNTAEFEKFADLFNDYHAKLEDMPAAWQELNAAMEGAGDAGKSLAEGALTGKEALALAFAQAELIGDSLTKAVKAQNALGDASHSTNKRMSELAKTAKGLGSEISGVGKWVLRLGTGALAGLGLGAIVGGLGIGELTNALYSRSRTAGGVGLTPGQLASFQSYGEQFLGEGALHAAAAAQTTYGSAPYLKMLGIDFKRAQSMNTADLSFEMLKGAVRNWQGAQRSGMPPAASPLVKAYEDLGGNLEDVRRAVLQGGVPAVDAAQAKVRANAASMNYDPLVWTNFQNQLKATTFQLEAVFGKALSPLVPEFTQLSNEAVTALAAFAESKGFKEIIKDLKSDFGSLLSWLSDPKTIKGFEDFGSEVRAVADKLHWLLPEQTDKSVLPAIAQSDKWITGIGDAVGSAWKHMFNPSDSFQTGYDPKNNPLDLTMGSSFGRLIFSRYKTIDEGIRAGAARLERYPANWGTKTIAQAIPVWAGETAQQAAGYIANVEKWSHVSRNTNIADLTRSQLSAVVAAMSRMEGTAVVSPDQVMHALYGSDTSKRHTDRIVKALKKSAPRNVQISISNPTSSRVAISANAISVG